MEIKELCIDAKFAVGIKQRTSRDNESDPQTALIPGLWQQFFSENVEDDIPNKLEDGNIIGVYTDYDADHQGEYTLIAAHEVTAIENISNELAAIQIPAGRYLVFSEQGQMPDTIYTLWKNIWDYFSSEQKVKRAYTTDFEYYDRNNTTNVVIYVAVLPE